MEDANARTIRHESEHGRWELVRGTPAPALRGAILRYQGYVEDRTTFSTRLEAPHPNIVLIVNLGPEIRISGPGHPAAGVEMGSFIAGLHDRHVFVAATGPMR
ncbi:MAG: hypothetical protein IT336_13220, partial [Thermomicrobiales bacterium]|nr:hypothetical protein [Thermomicrobiales bacterium]